MLFVTVNCPATELNSRIRIRNERKKGIVYLRKTILSHFPTSKKKNDTYIMEEAKDFV